MKDLFVETGETTTQETIDGLVPQMGATLCRSPFSMLNEIRAMEMLQQVAMEALLRYQTTLAQDEDLLQAGFPWRRRWFGAKQENRKALNALIVRRGEKLVIQHVYSLATIALEFLGTTTNADFETYKGMLAATLETDEPLLVT